MAIVTRVALPGPVTTAASDGETVWCVIAAELVAFAVAGAPRYTAPAPPRLQSLASAGNTLAAALEPGIVAWLDRGTGSVLQRRPLGGSIVVASGGGAVWVVDTSSSRAWRLAEPGVLIGPVTLSDVDRVAPEGERIWWTSRGDTALSDGERTVDLGIGSSERGGIVACAGSIWISVRRGLVRVGAWGGERGPLVHAPLGPVPWLVCADEVLVGGSSEGLFALDPNIDADARRLAVEISGSLQLLVAAGTRVWAFPAERAEAYVVAVRPE